MTRIVVLDSCDLGSEGIARLRALGTVDVYTDVPVDAEETKKRLDGADIAVVGWTTLSGDILAQLPSLRMISVWATGYDHVDVRAAQQHGVTVTNVPAYAGSAVAELTLALMLAVARQVARGDRRVRSGDFSWQGLRGVELAGRTLGIIGVGDIGGSLASIATALGMRVIAHARDMSSARAQELGVEFTSLADLVSTSDFLSLHLPLTEDTRGIIGRREIMSMKPGAFLINTARAALVDQAALRDALTSGRLGGAGLDDLDPEFRDVASLDNVVATPHIGFYTDAALERKGAICVSNVEAFLQGRVQNAVAGTHTSP